MMKHYQHFKKQLTASHSIHPLKRFLMWLVVLTLAGGLVSLFILTITIGIFSIGLPDVTQFDKLAGVESTVILDREEGILYTIHGEENRKYVPLSEISPHLQKATIAIEDDQFYTHSGFDISGIAAAGLHEVFGIGARRGGSTITQQLAKNAFLSSQRKITRKIKELILAIRLERAYDKNKILELYLNRIPYGNNAYGAEMAARLYFGKPARELTLPEAAVLASLPNGPTLYSPYGPYLYSSLDHELDGPVKLTDLTSDDYTTGLIGKEIVFSPDEKIYLPGRADLVLRRMAELKVITTAERDQAAEELHELEFSKHREAIRAAHFVFEIRRELEEKFGKEVVAQGGLQVLTTLDPTLQEVAEQAVADQIEANRESKGVTTGAVLTVDTQTGEILAMVGAADYFDEEAHGNVNHVYARRQPGSSFKPIIYAKAFVERYAPATVIYDTPTDFGNYRPQNYDGKFPGPMTIRRALGQSRNIPAIKAYFLAGQQEQIVPFAKSLGITSLSDTGDYGPALALGAGETTLSEMVQAFSVFATEGVKRESHAIVKVTNRNGDVLYERTAEEATQAVTPDVLDPQVAYLINDVLSDKSVSLGPRLDIPGHTTAVKTGTSNKEVAGNKILPSNVWTVGYTPSIVTGVWAGNSDGTPMKLSADGYGIAAPIWNKVMTAALKDKPDERFVVPEGIQSVVVSRASGKLPSADTPSDARISDVFASFSIPTEVDDLYKKIDVVKGDGLLPNEFTPADQIESRLFLNHNDAIDTFPSWLAGIKSWVAGRTEQDSTFPGFAPTKTTALYTAETARNKPTITITSPTAFSIISERNVPIKVQVHAPNGVKEVEFFLGNRTVPNSQKFAAPYTGSIHFLSSYDPGTYTIRALIIDDLGYTDEATIEVRFEGLETGSSTDSSEESSPKENSSSLLPPLLQELPGT